MHLIPVSCLPSGCELVTHQRLPTDQTPGHLALNQQPSWCVSPHSPAPLAARHGRLLDSGQGNGAEGTCVFQIGPQKHRALFHTLMPFLGQLELPVPTAQVSSGRWGQHTVEDGTPSGRAHVQPCWPANQTAHCRPRDSILKPHLKRVSLAKQFRF